MTENVEKVAVIVGAVGDIHTAPLPQHLRPVQSAEVQAVLEVGVAGQLTEGAEKCGQGTVLHTVQA